MTVQIRAKYEDWPLEPDNGGLFLVFSRFTGQGRTGQGRAGHRAQHQGTNHTTRSACRAQGLGGQGERLGVFRRPTRVPPFHGCWVALCGLALSLGKPVYGLGLWAEGPMGF